MIKFARFIFALLIWCLMFVIGLSLIVLTWPLMLMIGIGLFVHFVVYRVMKDVQL